MLGAVALGAVVVSAISFAVVDVSISNANGCIGARTACLDESVPAVAVTFAVLGVLALMISIVPALQWFIRAVQLSRAEDHEDHEAHDGSDHEVDAEAARQRILQRLTLEKDDVT